MTAALNHSCPGMHACADRGRMDEKTLRVFGLVTPPSSKTTKTD
jgi:hypothetical protein